MQNSRKLPALASVAAFAATLIIGLAPSSTQMRCGGAQNGASGYHYGGGFGGANGAGGELGQSLNTIFAVWTRVPAISCEQEAVIRKTTCSNASTIG